MNQSHFNTYHPYKWKFFQHLKKKKCDKKNPATVMKNVFQRLNTENKTREP